MVRPAPECRQIPHVLHGAALIQVRDRSGSIRHALRRYSIPAETISELMPDSALSSARWLLPAITFIGIFDGNRRLAINGTSP